MLRTILFFETYLILGLTPNSLAAKAPGGASACYHVGCLAAVQVGTDASETNRGRNWLIWEDESSLTVIALGCRLSSMTIFSCGVQKRHNLEAWLQPMAATVQATAFMEVASIILFPREQLCKTLLDTSAFYYHSWFREWHLKATTRTLPLITLAKVG